MARVIISQDTFVSGSLSPHVSTRFRLPQFTSGFSDSDNFLVTPYGTLQRRPGTFRLDSYASTGLDTASLYNFYISGDRKVGFMGFDSETFKSDTIVDTTPSLEHGLSYISSKNAFTDTISEDKSAIIKQILSNGYSSAGQGNGTITVSDNGIISTSGKDGEVSVLKDIKGFPEDSLKMVGPFNDVSIDVEIEVHEIPGETQKGTVDFNSTEGSYFEIKVVKGDVKDVEYREVMFRITDPDDSSKHLYFSAYCSSGNKETKIVAAFIPKGSAFLVEEVPELVKGHKFLEIRLGSYYCKTDDRLASLPTSVCFSNDRLVIGGGLGSANKVYGSVLSDHLKFTPIQKDGKVFDTDSFAYGYAEPGSGSLQWLSTVRGGIVIGTETSELFMGSSSVAITPTKPPSVRKISSVGSGKHPSIVNIGDDVVFYDKSGTRLYQASYVYDNDSVTATEISVLSRDILEAGIVDMVFDEEHTAIWCVLTDGTMAAVTYSPSISVVAWHRHSLSTGKVKAISVIASQGKRDAVVFLVEKDNKFFIEVMSEGFNSSSDDRYKGVYLDGSVLVDNISKVPSALSSDANARFLVNGKVSVGDDTSNGYVVCGYSYESFMVTLPLFRDFGNGSTLNTTTKITDVLPYVLNSGFAEYSLRFNNEGSWEKGTYREDPFGKMGSPVSLTTGTIDVPSFNSGSGTSPTVKVSCDNPFPYVLCSLSFNMNIHMKTSLNASGVQTEI